MNLETPAMIDQQRYEELRKNEHLPSPRGAALRLMELCRRDNASLAEIVRTLGTDPALAGQVIKIANAPAYGRSRPVVALSPDVIASIGILTLRQMVLAFSLISTYRQGECKAFDYASFWSRSTATALAANNLGILVAVAPHAELFTCGLLSNIGRLTLAAVYPEAYSDLLCQCHGQNPQALLEGEQRSFALDHNQLSAAMLLDWGIPKLFSEAVLVHETPAACDAPPGSRPYRLAYLLHLAAQLAESCFLDEHQRSAQLPRLFHVAENIGLSPEQLVRAGDQMLAEWHDWSTLLQIVTHDVASFSNLETEAAAASSPAVEEDARDLSSAQGMRLLVADDDAVLLMLLQKKLSQLGYEVFTAADGRQALELFNTQQPQIVISDAMMPGLSGLDLCRAIRQTPAGHTTYFIILTAHKESGHLVAAFQAGADDFIGKPVDAKLLLGRLAAATRIARLQQMLEADRQQHSAEEPPAEAVSAGFINPATGLPNRRYALARLNEQWTLAERNHVPFCCLRLHWDGYAAVVENHGPAQAEALLGKFAGLLKESSRLADTICHLDDANFLLIAPNTPIATAAQYAERLVARIAQSPFSLDGQPLPANASIGAAASNSGAGNAQQLLDLAEQALSQAQANGGGVAVAEKKA
jgi:diguanylate cyclase (GGDEF)-like protein